MTRLRLETWPSETRVCQKIPGTMEYLELFESITEESRQRMRERAKERKDEKENKSERERERERERKRGKERERMRKKLREGKIELLVSTSKTNELLACSSR
jgi:FtsZ-interacting cell division protein YlmF